MCNQAVSVFPAAFVSMEIIIAQFPPFVKKIHKNPLAKWILVWYNRKNDTEEHQNSISRSVKPYEVV